MRYFGLSRAVLILTLLSSVCVLWSWLSPAYAHAATMRVAPDTGVYTVGGTFTARIVLNTAGEPINAAEGALSYDPQKLSVVNVSRASSIFNLWTEEPTYSNSSGRISFGGGSPNGYTGSNGTILTVTFRALSAGTEKLSFSSGSVLAADGQGTNVLTSMSGGTFTLNAQTADPDPEPVYVPPANTPDAPVVSSRTHPDEDGWFARATATLSWDLPADVTSVRTLLDSRPGTIPTKVYDTPIDTVTVSDLTDGVSYFHIQFRNSDGWGEVTHYRIGVDTEKPSSFTISQPEDQDPGNPRQTLLFDVTDTSPITRYDIQIDGGDPITFTDEEEKGRYTLPELEPGRHTVIVEAFDSAGNSLVSTYSFDIAAFDKPVFTEYPQRLNTGVVPVFRGSTRPNAEVTITLTNTDGGTETFTTQSGDDGAFTFIPEESLAEGVYDLTAEAVDERGAQSEPSQPIRIIVSPPGYLQIGTFLVSALSVFVPTVALILLLIFGIWYLWYRLARWRRRITKETKEAEYRLAVEFDAITSHLGAQVEKLKKSRKGRLTKAESALLDELYDDIENARKKIHKEISDIDDVVE